MQAFEKDIIKLVCKKILTIFNQHNIDYWIDFGTLLGAIREKDIIDWDTDVDISIIHTEAPRVALLLTNELGIKKHLLQNIQCFDDGGIKIFFHTNIFIDIYPWKKEGNIVQYNPRPNELISGFSMPIFPIKEIEDFIIIPFIETFARIPINYHDRLVRLYNDYMTPVKPDPMHRVYWDGNRVGEYMNRTNQVSLPQPRPITERRAALKTQREAQHKAA